MIEGDVGNILKIEGDVLDILLIEGDVLNILERCSEQISNVWEHKYNMHNTVHWYCFIPVYVGK